MLLTTLSGMVIPACHINGTSKRELVKQLGGARIAIDKAINALAAASPHGRDYYVQDDGAFRTAVKQHQDRLSRLRAVNQELDDIVYTVDQQAGGR